MDGMLRISQVTPDCEAAMQNSLRLQGVLLVLTILLLSVLRRVAAP